MPLDFRELVAPSHTAVVTCEMQRGIIGDVGHVVELAAEVREHGVIEAAATLARGARAAGVRVVHNIIAVRADYAGLSINNPMAARTARSTGMFEGDPGTEVVPELGPEPEDIVCRRIHGLTPFNGTELDAILRNLGVRTIVPVGVSLNEALLGLCICAADLGYSIALPTDAVAGVPHSYGRDVIQYSLAYLSNLTTTADVLAAWR